ncbi:hypothetical protein ABZ547_20675 [Streptomyces sparsogenes]|uniref:hypothetical protein n=1 Tax=Streptomyces sparsogenes TaxID=67365 RepID=UPI0033FA8E98
MKHISRRPVIWIDYFSLARQSSRRQQRLVAWLRTSHTVRVTFRRAAPSFVVTQVSNVPYFTVP